MNSRIDMLKQHIQRLNDKGPRRTTFYPLVGQSLIKNTHLPVPVRRAQAFSDLLDKTEQVILPYELITGSILGSWPIAGEDEQLCQSEQIEQAMDAVQRYLLHRNDNESGQDRINIGFKKQVSRSDARFALMARDHYDASISFADMQEVIKKVQAEYSVRDEIEPYEIARIIERHFEFGYDKLEMKALDELPWESANHVDLNYSAALETGLGKLIFFIEEKLKITKDDEKLFYEAELIALQASIRFIERYATALENKMDAVESERAAELQKMACICRKVAREKPACFREGLQLVWMLHVIGNLAGGSALSFARFDQYMRELYEEDLNNGKITRHEAALWLSCIWLKVNEPKMRTVQSLCLGGIRPDGTSGASDLSRLVLETIRALRLPYPNVSVRFNPSNSPDWLLEEAVKTVQSGFGQPMLLNDQLWIPNLMKLGYPQEIARDYYNMGCVEIMIQGKQPNWAGGGGINFPRHVLNVIEAAASGRLQLPDFDAFMEQYQQGLRCEIDQLAEKGLRKVRYAKQHYFDPYASLFVSRCLEKGKDFFQGGTELPYPIAISGTGLGTAADSLLAVKKLVYEDAELSMSEMAHMLANNFIGFETIHQTLQRGLPSYGNDIDEVDTLAAIIFKSYADHVYSQNDKSQEGRFVNVLFTYNSHVSQGEITGATPDGRLKGQTLSDCVGPVQGKDVNGPTRMINSVLKLDSSKVTGAYALNVKLNPTWAGKASVIPVLTGLVKAYFHDGGPQIQFNMQKAKDLKAAQADPVSHRDVVVRIAGYCEYFVNLDRQLQNEIISRTEHGL